MEMQTIQHGKIRDRNQKEGLEKDISRKNCFGRKLFLTHENANGVYFQLVRL